MDEQLIDPDELLHRVASVRLTRGVERVTGKHTVKARDLIGIHMDELLACLQRQLRLEWLYEKPFSRPPAGRPESRPIVVPPRKDLEALLEFAEISHVTGLQKSLESLKKVDEKFTPFATTIEELVESFQFEKVVEMIESYLQGQEE